MKKKALNRKYPVDREWVDAVVDNIDVLTGRRGNKITPPTKATLTFSATPTQAECEALYAYVNNVLRALVSVVNRMDQ